MSEEIKLLVISTLKMDKVDLRYYAKCCCSRTEDMEVDEFLDKIYNGERMCVEFPDGTVTTYEIIKEG